MKKFAIVLSGCGVFDGAEIHEATLTMYSISKNGATYDIFAPNIEQHNVIDHLTGSEMSEKRNVMIEAARIARGDVKDLKDFDAASYDALIFPGGFGAAKNLCAFAFDGPDCIVNPDVEKALLSMREKGKPIGALCISPVLFAKVFGNNVELTIGRDKGTAESIEAMGANHKVATHGEVVVDENNKLFTTPGYMLDATIAQIGEGADNIVKAMLEHL